MKYNDYQLIKKDLREYVSRIRIHTNNLRSDFVAEWALLTTISCWGAPEGIIRVVSFVITLIFFTSKIYVPPKKRTTPDFLFVMRERITDTNLSVEQMIFANKRLIKIEKITRNSNVAFYISRCWKFILGYLFLVLSSVASMFFDLNF
ncbi:hypothetical protein UZ962_22205 [Escherichia coli]|nr:hypothetical protein [Escherichia coli]MDY9212533.1 hypothetical protein [Escherichia coli]MDY9267105.1 hypothetical protein [Escherichia coli]MDY9321888.1 hypothetical protein [Escherichia coli]MDY9326758.1 hypothetical protein [Escherichia coli]